jgi:hypothetical protein
MIETKGESPPKKVGKNTMKTHKKQAASFMIVIFAAVILAISASTSFGFFFEFFNALVPPELFGEVIGAIISGVIGVLLFDVASALWLNTFLNHAETPEQRAITLLMTMITFTGASAASVAHLSLTATGGAIYLEASAKETIGIVALIVVIAGVILNFGATLAYNRFSIESKMSVRESDRLDTVQKAEDEQAIFLDSLIAQNVKELLEKQAPDLARIQAGRIAAQVYRREKAKYAGDGVPAGQPKREVATPAPLSQNGFRPQ